MTPASTTTKRHRSAIAAAALFAGAPLLAQDRTALARQHFEAGVREFQAQHFREARAAFEASLEAQPVPATRLYLARTLRQLDEPAAAYELLAPMLSQLEAEQLSTGRPSRVLPPARLLLEELRALVGLVTVRVCAASSASRAAPGCTRPASVSVHLGARPLALEALANPQATPPGALEVRAEAPGYASAVVRREVSAGARIEVTLSMRPDEPARAEPSAAPPLASASAPARVDVREPSAPVRIEPPPATGASTPWSSGPAVAGWVTLGVGVAGLGAGVALYSVTEGAFQSAVRACPSDEACAPDRVLALREQVRGLALGTNVSLLAGAAVGAAGLGIALWGGLRRPARHEERARGIPSQVALIPTGYGPGAMLLGAF